MELLPTEMVALADLTPHPQNYRTHPPEQVQHIAESVQRYGFYRPIVTAQDLTILAGHGVRLAARSLGYEQVPVVRLPIDAQAPAALKVLALDNELTRFADTDDRQLADILRTIRDDDVSGLLGTGYDDSMLANLVMVTRHGSEIEDFDAASQWVGMPEYEADTSSLCEVVILFQTTEDRDTYVAEHDLHVLRGSARRWSARWPWQGFVDEQSVAWEEVPA